MTNFKLTGTALRAAVAIGIAVGGITAATAQTSNSMGGMQMAPGSKMDMKAPMPAKKAALRSHATQHKHATLHKHAKHHHSATTK